MLIDYLRYVAFAGRLQGFFEGGLSNYVEPEATTGQHLRFSSEYLDECLGWPRHRLAHDNLYWNPRYADFRLEEIKYCIGIQGGFDQLGDTLAGPNKRPMTSSYKEVRTPRLEIIIDIDPDRWSGRYSERASYEDTPIIYRRAAAAKANVSSGDRLFARGQGPSAFGTLCGVFRETDGSDFGLTCGHVVASGAKVMVERPRRPWALPFWPRRESLGEVQHLAAVSPTALPTAPVQVELDAALIAIRARSDGHERGTLAGSASLRPISAMLQEEPVRFSGAGGRGETLARISAVTVRKSIDLYKTGKLCSVGDVLMLGHLHKRYITQRVSRPGDSGAAVRQVLSSSGPFPELSYWYGMILGSDDEGAYATHAEHLWAWAQRVTGDPDVEFRFGI